MGYLMIGDWGLGIGDWGLGILDFAENSVGGKPAVRTPLATSRETRPTQWLNFSKRILDFGLNNLKSTHCKSKIERLGTGDWG
ncbi:hypothetical protein H6G36_12390 [Anabaena minutissima FACHB-250]|nr:hypothetical protein [Anabaena minutissima FACHB-250]